MFFDTHAHLDDTAFDADRASLIESFKDTGVTRVLNASSNMASSHATVALSEKYDFIYGAVGVHPDSAERFSEEDLEEIEKLLTLPRIVAIGECGLDYYYDDVPPEIQREVFDKQAALAYELGRPIIVHDRDAHRDCLEILKKFPGIAAVYHCFSGSVEYARELVKLGFYVSFGGAVTFKNARCAPEVLKDIPHERVLLETDCPYMAPVPHRGKRNHPGFIPLIAEKIGELWGMSAEEVGRITTKNANTFFCID
ncbi:MAG: TatD family hydrolase [Oscillospiraceae bacterium]|nr:TatD family hydrolase [Oscillospiraceae bacterium]